MIFDYSGHLTGLGVLLLLVGLAAFVLNIWMAIVVIWAGHKYLDRVRAEERAAEAAKRKREAEAAPDAGAEREKLERQRDGVKPSELTHKGRRAERS